jgi:hypothetical protein
MYSDSESEITNDELLALKEQIDRVQKNLYDYQDEVREERKDYLTKIKEQKQLCGDQCLKDLQKHLDICDGGYSKDDPNYGKPYYKCERESVCYNCDKSNNIENNGRCSHFYEIKHLDERLENLEWHSEDLSDQIIDLQVEYDRKLAIKEGRYEQYKEDLWDYFA